VAVLVAVALAALASAAAYVGLHSAQKKAEKNAGLTSVYVLKGTVPTDDSAAAAYSQGLIRVIRMPLQFVPAGAVTNLSVIHDHLSWYDLPAGEVVTGAMFVAPGALHSIASERLPRGDVAVSVSVDQAHGVAGLIQPGDKVDILTNIGGRQETFLYQSVPVLAVGTTLVTPPGKSSTSGAPSASDQARNIITFAVTRPDATRIAQASSGGGGVSGSLYLALASPGSAKASSSVVTVSNLVSGSPAAASPPIPGPNPAPSGVTPGTGHVSQSTQNDTVP